MRVLFLSFYYQPDLSAGSFRATSLVGQLLAHGAEVEVITTLPNRYSSYTAEASEFQFNERLKIHRVPVPSHKSGMLDQIKAFIHYYKGVSKLTRNQRYDLVFATSSKLFTAFLGARVAKKKSLLLYLDIRDIFVDTIKDILDPKLLWFLKPVLLQVERYTFSNADRINLVSEGFKDYFASRFTNCDYRFFTNGIDKEFLDLDIGDNVGTEVKTFNRAVTPIKIVYAGNIGEGQGLHSIIPQLSSLLGKSFEFVVIGDGGKKQKLVESSVGVENLKLLPPVKRTDLIDVYKDADILFLHLNNYPAFEKVLPSKIFEYSALGKPILAGVSGYAAKFLTEEVENSAVFEPGNVLQAERALHSLKLQSTDRSSFKKKFARDVIMNRMANDIISVFRTQ